MNLSNMIDFFIDRNKAVITVLMIILIFGSFQYYTIPKESNPDISLPVVNIHLIMRGISAIDSDRLLISPTRIKLASVNGVKEIKSFATNNIGYLSIEFEKWVDIKDAKHQIEQIVNDLKTTDYPKNLNATSIKEVSLGLFPVINVVVSGNVTRNQLTDTAELLKDAILDCPGVLDVSINGFSKRSVEIVIEPFMLEKNNISIENIISAFNSNNSFLAVGSIERSHGKYNLRLDTVLKNIEEIKNLPIINHNLEAIKIKDVANVNIVFEDSKSTAFSDHLPAMILKVSKVLGYSITETIDGVKKKINSLSDKIDENITINYSQDNSSNIREFVWDLQNQIIISTLVVFLVIFLFTELRSALLVSTVIPISFLLSILIISAIGYTINMVVLFSLIFSVGLIVDPSIVVVEYADRLIATGSKTKEAFRKAATTMFYPIISSTLTTQIVFMPLILWPGTTGGFIKFLPITTIVVLFSSMVVALFFLPVMGFSFIDHASAKKQYVERMSAIEMLEVYKFDFISRVYYRWLNFCISNSSKVIRIMILFSVLAFLSFKFFGSGIIFFPDVEPSNAVINIRTFGEFSNKQKIDILNYVAGEISEINKDISISFSKIVNSVSNDSIEKDLIAQIFLQFKKWNKRRNFAKIKEIVSSVSEKLDGIKIEIIKEDQGPSNGSDIQLALKSKNADIKRLYNAHNRVLNAIKDSKAFIDIKDSLFPDSIEWNIDFDYEKAKYLKISRSEIANILNVLTDGIVVSKYNNDGEIIDIKVIYDEKSRNLDTIKKLQFIDRAGKLVSMHSIVNIVPRDYIAGIERLNEHHAIYIHTNVRKGINVYEQIDNLKLKLPSIIKDSGIDYEFIGEAKEMKRSLSFLFNSFVIAISGIMVILMFMFNSYSQSFLIMSSIIFSSVGVVFGSLITLSPISVVMSGCAIIALAGISVNNNILLIDSYNHFISENLSIKDAIVRACISRLRPILITSITTALGLLPMMFKLNIDLIGMEISYNAPATQYWVDLSKSIVFGMFFTTFMTLFFTPAVLNHVSAKNKSSNNDNLID